MLFFKKKKPELFYFTEFISCYIDSAWQVLEHQAAVTAFYAVNLRGGGGNALDGGVKQEHGEGARISTTTLWNCRPNMNSRLKRGSHRAAAGTLECFRLVGSAQSLLFPVIIHPGGFMCFMNQRTGQFCSSPFPPARSPARFLALCSICRLPPRFLPGPAGLGFGHRAGEPPGPAPGHPLPPAPGLRRAHGRQKHALQSPYTHTHIYIWIFISPAPDGDPATSVVFLLTLTRSSLLKPK